MRVQEERRWSVFWVILRFARYSSWRCLLVGVKFAGTVVYTRYQSRNQTSTDNRRDLVEGRDVRLGARGAEAEIGELDVTVGRDKNVIGLQVAKRDLNTRKRK